MILCEAAGMAPQLAAVADNFGIQVRSSGGFDSLTEQHALGKLIAEQGDTEILHIGDHDPSGAHLFLALKENLEAFAAHYGGFVAMTRLAVTPDQIKSLRLPTAPPKSSDNRAFRGQTCQAEAIPPDVLARIVREAIELRLDLKAYRRVLNRKKQIRRKLTARFK
jgi:hypothetical protein